MAPDLRFPRSLLRRLRASSVSSHDVMATDPYLPTAPPYPVAWPPHVIRASVPVTGTAIVRSIANRDHDRAASIGWAGTVVRPVPRIGTIIPSTPNCTEQHQNQKNQRNQSSRSGFFVIGIGFSAIKNAHFHIIIFDFRRILRACISTRRNLQRAFNISCRSLSQRNLICTTKERDVYTTP